MRPSAFVLGLFSASLTTFALAQGSLTPPGAPAASMRSLDQVQPRTPIPGGTTGFNITQSGSYYLTGNLTLSSGNGLTVSADNVSIDLNGFTISSTAVTPNGYGILLSGGRSHVAISNGHIRGTTTFSGSYTTGGFISGIDYAASVPRNVRVEGVSVSGTANYGIDLGTDRSTVIANSTVRTCQFIGLRAGAISDSAALEAGSTAISAGTASNVIGTLTGAGTAVVVTEATVSSVATQIASLQSTVAGSTDTRTRLAGGSGSTIFIGTSGSYVLTGNYTVADGDAIRIDADNVTLDLNGYTLTCTGGSSPGSGILINGARSNVTVRNGKIVGGTTFSAGTFTPAGFFNAIFASSSGKNIRVEDVSVSNVQRGIALTLTDESSVVRDCSATVVSTNGIVASIVSGSTARTCGGAGITGKSITRCIGDSVTGNGIAGENVADTFGTSAGAPGVAGISAVTVSNSTGTGTTAAGISAVAASSCRGISTSSTGLLTSQSATNCVGTSSSGTGLSSQLATMCAGTSTSGTGLTATIAVACRGSGTTPLNVTNRYNMP